MRHALLLTFAAATLAACQSTSSQADQPTTWSSSVSLPDVPLSVAPFDVVHVKWKERRREPYLFLDHVGDYRSAGARIAELFAEASSQQAPMSGAPFILFYDDPSVTPVAELKSRICIAIDDEFSALSPLYVDELPAQMVVYAAIAGPFPEVPRSYAGLFEYMAERSWVPRAPIRETYLVSPADHLPSELVTEVQIPWVPGG